MLGISGKAEAVDPDNMPVTVNGVTVNATEDTHIRIPKHWWEESEEPSLADLEADAPVRIAAQYADGDYFAMMIEVPKKPGGGQRRGNGDGENTERPEPGQDENGNGNGRSGGRPAR